jgi:hypothetical protein
LLCKITNSQATNKIFLVFPQIKYVFFLHYCKIIAIFATDILPKTKKAYEKDVVMCACPDGRNVKLCDGAKWLQYIIER